MGEIWHQFMLITHLSDMPYYHDYMYYMKRLDLSSQIWLRSRFFLNILSKIYSPLLHFDSVFSNVIKKRLKRTLIF